jgi:hypothetical protein
MPIFKHGDRSDAIANDKNMYIEIFHVNTGKAIQFKAFLTNFEDKYNTDYSTDFFVMHTEPIRKWKSTVREISLGWKIPANGVIEAKENLGKMSLLARMLYGEQVRERTGMVPRVGGGPIFKIRFLNWIAGAFAGGDSSGFVSPFGDAGESGLLGYISGFSFKPANITDGFLQEPPDGVGPPTPGTTRTSDPTYTDIYPRFIDVSITFYPVHSKSPAWVNQEFNYENFPYGVNMEDGDLSTGPMDDGTFPRNEAASQSPPSVTGAQLAAVTGQDPEDAAISDSICPPGMSEDPATGLCTPD